MWEKIKDNFNPETKSQILSKLALFFIGFIIAAVLLLKCEGNTPIDNTSVLNSRYDSLSKEVVKKDAVTDSLNKVVLGLDTVREKILDVYHVKKKKKNIHDTVWVTSFIQVCDSVITLDSTEISSLKALNKNLVDINKDKSDMLYNRDNVITRKDVTIDSLIKSKKKYWKGFKHGFVAGSIVIESLNIGVGVILK
jgi:hypothetical protein